MTLALEKLVGNPGQYSSIEAAMDDSGDAESSPVDTVRPGQQTRASGDKSEDHSFFLDIQDDATPPKTKSGNLGSPSNPETVQPIGGGSMRHSLGPSGSGTSFTSNAELSQPSTPDLDGENREDAGLLGLGKPFLKRTAGALLDPWKQRPNGRRSLLKERLEPLAHKSLNMRDIQIIVESFPNSEGKRAQRTFWSYTDDSGRFSEHCSVPFKPERVCVFAGETSASQNLVYVPQHGVSVISDVDDTVRHSGVTKSKRELLQNVLAKHFDECRVDGVAEWYNAMHEAGASFHYVSNSPWQLYHVVEGFLRHHNFPQGTIHLKKYASIFDSITEPVLGRKRATLDNIFQDFPDRKFILIGDSGEADLEAYAEVAEKYPDQVLAVYIRDITLGPEHLVLVPNDEIRSNGRRDVPPLPPRAEQALNQEFIENEGVEMLYHSQHHKPDKFLVPRKAVSQIKTHTDSEELHAATPTVSPTPPPPPKSRVPSSGTDSTRSSSPASTVSDAPVVSQLPSKPALPSQFRKAVSSPASSSTSLPKTHELCSPPAPPPPPSREYRHFFGNHTAQSSSNAPDVSEEKPELPPRQRLIHRTSSKLRESAHSVASASSSAVSRMLGPNASGGANNASASASSPAIVSGVSDLDIHTPPPLPRRVRTDDDKRGVRRVHSDLDIPIVPSSQDIVDPEKVVNKRAENWKFRLLRERRQLPRHIQLKTWRSPEDVEKASLILIHNDLKSK